MQTALTNTTARSNRWLILAVVVLAYLPIVIDMTVLHIAVPSLTLAIGASGEQVLWIIDIYPLIMAGLLVPMGTLADRIGSRNLLLAGLLVLVLMSAIAAFSPSAEALIAARAGMAIGAAMVVPCTLSIIRHAFEVEKERALALGLWGSVAAGGAALGPLVGGALLEHFWWGSVFLINVPVMLLVWPCANLVIPKNQFRATPSQWRIKQSLMLLAGMLATIYAVKTGVADGFSGHVLAILSTGLLLLTAFSRIQLTSSQPLLDLSLFSRAAIRSGLVMALVVSGALAGIELTIAQELQFVLGKSPFEAAMFLLPLMVAAVVGGPMAGYMVAIIGLRVVATASLICSALSLAGLGLRDFQMADELTIALLVLLGLSLSIGLTASSIAIMSSAPAEKAGAAGSLEATGYELGTGLGISLFGIILNLVYGNTLALPDGLSPGAANRALQSLGDTMFVANQLNASASLALSTAGREAFGMAHSSVLITAAYILAGLVGFIARLTALLDFRTGDEHIQQEPGQ